MGSDDATPRVVRGGRGARLFAAFVVLAVGLIALLGYILDGPDAAAEAATVRIVEPVEGARIPVDGTVAVKFHLDFGRRLTPMFFVVSLMSDDAIHGQVAVRGDDITHDPRSPWEATLKTSGLAPGKYRVEARAHLRRNASVPRGFALSPPPAPDPVRAVVTVEAAR